MNSFCAHPGCGAIVRRGRCAAHALKPWASATPRLRGRALQRRRLELYVRDPCCAHCGIVMMPGNWIRDHIVPLAEGGEDIESNTQGLCRACSDRKSHQEAARGRARNR